MPVITINIRKQTDEKRKEIIEALTNAASSATEMPAAAFTVYVNEFDLSAIGSGGVPLSEKK